MHIHLTDKYLEGKTFSEVINSKIMKNIMYWSYCCLKFGNKRIYLNSFFKVMKKAINTENHQSLNNLKFV